MVFGLLWLLAYSGLELRRAPMIPRVRTPCGHGAQVIVEGREKQPDGGENNKNHKHNPRTKQKAQSRVTTIM